MNVPVVRAHEPLRLLLEGLRRGEFGQLIVSSGEDSTFDFGSNQRRPACPTQTTLEARDRDFLRIAVKGRPARIFVC